MHVQVQKAQSFKVLTQEPKSYAEPFVGVEGSSDSAAATAAAALGFVLTALSQVRGSHLVISINRQTQYRPQYIILLLIGTSQNGPPILGTPLKFRL